MTAQCIRCGRKSNWYRERTRSNIRDRHLADLVATRIHDRDEPVVPIEPRSGAFEGLCEYNRRLTRRGMSREIIINVIVQNQLVVRDRQIPKRMLGDGHLVCFARLSIKKRQQPESGSLGER